MTYIDGFVAAVPNANREKYKKHAVEAAKVFEEYGALKVVECWGDLVPHGRAAQGRRERRILMDRLAVQGGTQDGLGEGDGRPTHAAGSECDAFRRQAHDLRRLRADRRALSR